MEIFGITAASLIPIVALAGGNMIRSIINKIDVLEKHKGMTEEEVRQLLEDKLEVLKVNHTENRAAIQKLFELYINIIENNQRNGDQ